MLLVWNIFFNTASEQEMHLAFSTTFSITAMGLIAGDVTYAALKSIISNRKTCFMLSSIHWPNSTRIFVYLQRVIVAIFIVVTSLFPATLFYIGCQGEHFYVVVRRGAHYWRKSTFYSDHVQSFVWHSWIFTACIYSIHVHTHTHTYT